MWYHSSELGFLRAELKLSEMGPPLKIHYTWVRNSAASVGQVENVNKSGVLEKTIESLGDQTNWRGRSHQKAFKFK